MTATIKYRVVKESYPECLEETVNSLLSEGWVVQGGVAGGAGWCAQAMIKEIPEGCEE